MQLAINSEEKIRQEDVHTCATNNRGDYDE